MAVQSEWQKARLRSELARGVHSKTGPVARFLQGKKPLKTPLVNKAAFDRLNSHISRVINDAIRSKLPGAVEDRSEAEAKAAAGERLYFDSDSTCFAELSWQEGMVYAVFQSGHEYEAELDLETFMDWTEDSAGKFFNGVMGRDFFKGSGT